MTVGQVGKGCVSIHVAWDWVRGLDSCLLEPHRCVEGSLNSAISIIKAAADVVECDWRSHKGCRQPDLMVRTAVCAPGRLGTSELGLVSFCA